jgi:hypothetical protein
MNFTTTELHTIQNTKFFSIKASVTKKIEHLFADVRDAIKSEIKSNNIIFPPEVDSDNGKIFRGENYLGLPYLVLDYPKHFSKDSVFAFRTMFWWGNFFSFTLHLQGRALEEWRRNKALLAYPNPPPKGGLSDLILSPCEADMRGSDVYICVNNSPWQYHYKKDNYLPINKLSKLEINKSLMEDKFIKLSRQLPFKEHKKLVGFAKESFMRFYT